MNKNSNISIIEQLPNEIFLEIFRFLDVRDLHRGWAKLNKRFSSLLRLVSMHAHLTRRDDYIGYKSYLRYYASQFIYIRIEQICDIPETFDVRHFSNIHSLHLGTVTSKQYDEITPKNMPYLTNLTVAQLQTHGNPIFLICGSKQFNHLKTCQLPYCFSANIQLQICLTVRSLHLNFCSTDVFLQHIKVLFPNLVYFESIFGTALLNFQFKQDMITPHNNLRHLKVEMKRQISMGFLDLLLTVTPELNYLELCFWKLYNYQSLAEILQLKAVKLKQFNFISKETDLNYINIDLVKEMSPWFAQMKIEKDGDEGQIACYSKRN